MDLFIWCRGEDNLESAFLSAELAMLYCWDLIKNLDDYPRTEKRNLIDVINSLLRLYRLVCNFYLTTKIIPYCHIKHGLSSAVRGRNHIDVNLKLFDILGRLSLEILWLASDISNTAEDNQKISLENIQSQYIQAIKNLINNNPILLSPYQEKQTTEVALPLLALNQEGHLTYIHPWLKAMLERIQSNFVANLTYPSTLSEYSELIEHPTDEQGYKEKVTKSSVLYTFLATYAAAKGMQDIYDLIKILHRDCIAHCSLQAWYLSDGSEIAIWKNNSVHGATLPGLDLNVSMHDWQEEVLYQCKNSPVFKELSAIKYGLPGLLLIACRRYQYPLPYDFLI